MAQTVTKGNWEEWDSFAPKGTPEEEAAWEAEARSVLREPGCQCESCRAWVAGCLLGHRLKRSRAGSVFVAGLLTEGKGGLS